MQETQETWVQSLGWKDPLKRKWQPTPVFLPGKSHAQRSLVGYSPWSHKESDMTERLTLRVYIRVDYWCYTLVALDGCIMTGLCHYSIKQYFHCPENPVFRLLFPPFSLNPGNHWSFYCLHNFAFSRMSHNWNHTVPSFSYWLLLKMNLSFLHQHKIILRCLGEFFKLVF